LWRLPGKLLSIGPSIHATRRLVYQTKPDLVHLNSSALAPSAIGAAQAGAPVVWHIREPLARGYLGLRRAWIRQVIDRYAERVIAICQHDAAQLIPSDRVRVIYNSVDFHQFDRAMGGEAIRAEFGIPAGAPVVLMLGGVARPKGTLTLIRAAPLVRQAIPDTVTLIAGPPLRTRGLSPLPPGQLAKEVGKLVLGADAYNNQVWRAWQRLGEADRAAVLFTGMRRDVPALLAASDLLVFPASVPHFARPVIEAAAMGKPAVASDLGGPDELIVHGETGLLCPPGDPRALAGAISGLLADPDRAQAMGEAAYQRARRLFDADTNAAATAAVYDELLE
jgi:glycosyltransferase involved in cell wall biosynthesis